MAGNSPRYSSRSRSRTRSSSSGVSRRRIRSRGRVAPATPKQTPVRRYSLADVRMSSAGRSRSRSTSTTRALVGLKRRIGGTQQTKSSGFAGQGGSKRLTPFDEFAKSGVTICRERGAVVTTPASGQMQMIGHNTLSRENLYIDVARSMTKYIVSKVGYSVFDFAQTVPYKISVFIRYKQNVTSAPTSFTYDILTTDTLEAAAGKLQAQFTLLFDTSPSTDIWFTQLTIIQYDTGGVNVIDRWAFGLSDAKIKLHVKSALKMQNRTQGAITDNESDDVNNVPLYGKFYEGSGNFIGFKKTTSGVDKTIEDFEYIGPKQTIAFIGTEYFGTYGLPGLLTEPPTMTQTTRCQKIGKIHLDAGQLKTSVLTFSKEYNFNKLMQSLAKRNESATQDIYWKGNYRIFALEKMMQSETTAVENGNLIKIAYEIDHKIGIAFQCKKENVTTTIVDSLPQ